MRDPYALNEGDLLERRYKFLLGTDMRKMTLERKKGENKRSIRSFLRYTTYFSAELLLQFLTSGKFLWGS